MRRLLGNIALALVVFLLMLVLAEGAWRLLISKGDRARHFDPVIGRVNPPNTSWTIRTPEYKTSMSTNSRGFRGPEMPGDRRSNEMRILFLGDSFVEAKQVPVQERFVEETGRILEKKMNRPVTVRALAVGASEPARELLYFEHIGTSFDPDIVVQVFFPENDLLAVSGSYLLHRENSHLILDRVWVDPLPLCDLKCWILSHSELAVRAYQLLRQSRGTGSKDLRSLLGEGQFYWYTVEGQDAAEREQRFDVLATFADAVRSRTEKNGGQYLAVLMPGGFEIHEDWQNDVLARFEQAIPRTNWRPAGLLDGVTASLAERRIHTLDLRPSFREAAPSGHLYFTLDPHLSPVGHRLTAERISEAISSLRP